MVVWGCGGGASIESDVRHAVGIDAKDGVGVDEARKSGEEIDAFGRLRGGVYRCDASYFTFYQCVECDASAVGDAVNGAAYPAQGVVVGFLLGGL